MRTIDPISIANVAAKRSFVLGMMSINGQAFDMSRVDVHAKLGTTEIWTIQNQAAINHPFHVHGYSFQVIDRNGKPAAQPAWEDTVNVASGDVVRIALRFDDLAGTRMYHCHILEHEDQGMMGVFDVR
jgi:bilirubin oxidase